MLSSFWTCRERASLASASRRAASSRWRSSSVSCRCAEMSRTSQRNPIAVSRGPPARHGQGDRGVERRAVPRLEPDLERLGGRLRLPAAELGAHPGAVVRRDERDQRLARHEAWLDPQEPRRGAVGLADDAVQVGQQIGIRSELEQLLVSAPLLDHRAVRFREALVLLPHLLFRDPELLHRPQQLVERLLAGGDPLLVHDGLHPPTDGRQPPGEVFSPDLEAHDPPSGRAGRTRGTRHSRSRRSRVAPTEPARLRMAEGTLTLWAGT